MIRTLIADGVSAGLEMQRRSLFTFGRKWPWVRDPTAKEKPLPEQILVSGPSPVSAHFHLLRICECEHEHD